MREKNRTRARLNPFFQKAFFIQKPLEQKPLKASSQSFFSEGFFHPGMALIIKVTCFIGSSQSFFSEGFFHRVNRNGFNGRDRLRLNPFFQKAFFIGAAPGPENPP